MRRTPKIRTLAATLALIVAAPSGWSQMTGGQANAAKSLAGQARGGQPSAARPSPAASSVAASPDTGKSYTPPAAPKSPSVAEAAQASQQRAAQANAAAPSQAAPAPQAPNTSADAGSRRDPFRPLVVKGKSDELPTRLPPGKAGLVIGQLTIQGIVRGINDEWIAVVDNKTKRAYFLFAGDELFNGVVNRINENSVVFSERYMDNTGRQLTREVVKQMAQK